MAEASDPIIEFLVAYILEQHSILLSFVLLYCICCMASIFYLDSKMSDAKIDALNLQPAKAQNFVKNFKRFAQSLIKGLIVPLSISIFMFILGGVFKANGPSTAQWLLDFLTIFPAIVFAIFQLSLPKKALDVFNELI